MLRRLAGTCPSLGLRGLLFGIGRFGSCPTGEGASRCGTAFLRGEQGDVAKGCQALLQNPLDMVPVSCKVAGSNILESEKALLSYSKNPTKGQN